MKKIYLLFIVAFSVNFLFAETYTSFSTNGWIGGTTWTRQSDGAVVTVDINGFRNSSHEFIFEHDVNTSGWTSASNTPDMVIRSGVTVTGGIYKNINLTVEVGATLNIDSYDRDNDNVGTFVNNGTTTISGELNAHTTNTGTLTVNSIGHAQNGTLLINNSGSLTVNTAQSYTGNKRTITNTGNMTIDGALTIGNADNKLYNNGTLTIKGALNYSNGEFQNDNIASNLTVNGLVNMSADVTLNNSGDIIAKNGIKLDGNAVINNKVSSSIDVTGNMEINGGNNYINNYGDIDISGALKYTNGNLNNYAGGNIVVSGTGSLLNATVIAKNGGYIEFSDLLTVTNTTIQNTLNGESGHIDAKKGVKLENDGCISGGSLDYWGSISGGDGSCTFAGVTLPIELLSFYGNTINNAITLNWETSSEKNNDYFTIEKSTDAFTFEHLTTIDGAGNSSIKLSYSTTDSKPAQGINYYRIKQTDFDGSSKYFTPIAVSYTSISAFIYPTVISDETPVNVSFPQTEKVKYTIVAQNGRILKAGYISNFEQISPNHFDYGINQIIIGDNDIIAQIIKQ